MAASYHSAMSKTAFAHVTHWVFDLDNTLYPRAAGLFARIERRMNAYVARELKLAEAQASVLRQQYWRRYGTTLAGLMQEHGADPDPYLREVHDIDLSDIAPDPGLATAINRLPGRKIVFTNGSRLHGRNVSAACGLAACFDAIYGIEDAACTPKPDARAFARIFGLDGLNPVQAAMFEDDAVNLRVPHQLGMRTVLVGADDNAEYIHHRTNNLAGFLTQLV